MILPRSSSLSFHFFPPFLLTSGPVFHTDTCSTYTRTHARTHTYTHTYIHRNANNWRESFTRGYIHFILTCRGVVRFSTFSPLRRVPLSLSLSPSLSLSLSLSLYKDTLHRELSPINNLLSLFRSETKLDDEKYRPVGLWSRVLGRQQTGSKLCRLLIATSCIFHGQLPITYIASWCLVFPPQEQNVSLSVLLVAGAALRIVPLRLFSLKFFIGLT